MPRLPCFGSRFIRFLCKQRGHMKSEGTNTAIQKITGCHVLMVVDMLCLPLTMTCPGDGSSMRHHSLAQLSVAQEQRSCLGLVVSATTQGPSWSAPASPQGAAGPSSSSSSSTNATASRVGFTGLLAPSVQHAPALTSTDTAAAAAAGASTRSAVRLGLAGSATLGDALVVSAWHVRKVVQSGHAAANAAIGGGSSTGMRLATAPDDSGVVVALACSASSDGLSSGGSRPGSGAVVAELSASLPVLDGLMLTPGAVLVRRGGCTTGGLVLQSSWRF